jgi:hypothetical protein
MDIKMYPGMGGKEKFNFPDYRIEMPPKKGRIGV